MVAPSRLPSVLLALLLLGPYSPAHAEDGAQGAYRVARANYYALKRDPAHRKLRHHWLRVARLFEDVARKYPKSQRAPEALFTAAQLFEDLSRISLLPEDRASAAATYEDLVEAHPQHRLADDAALALAKLQIERQGKPDVARKTLLQALKQQPKGDRAGELRALLASLPASAAPIASPLRSVLSPRGETPLARARAHLLRSRPAVDAGEPTLAQQLGLKMRRVVIDPGHGGHDGGAVGASGTREKDVALAISEKLAEILEEAGLETVLTRDDDRFVPLEERTRRANEAKGDLFVSIHCNAAASPKLRGVETYTLNLSSDRYAIRLAARENASSEKGMSDLQFLLADLAAHVNTDESRRLARQIQSELADDLVERGGKDLGTKEALFLVLLGAKMPAVLVETSFLSNTQDEALLASTAYQEQIAKRIAHGVQAFLDNRDRVARTN
jgi:N-acetylmuramoyl-L-alanine amidase